MATDRDKKMTQQQQQPYLQNVLAIQSFIPECRVKQNAFAEMEEKNAMSKTFLD